MNTVTQLDEVSLEAGVPEAGLPTPMAVLHSLIDRGHGYECLVIDPPWKYEDEGCRGGAAKHYDTMLIDEIAALPIPSLHFPHSHVHLWLWVTNHMVDAGHQLLRHWSLRHIGMLTWVKTTREGAPALGTGRYLRGSTEHLLCATAGKTQFRRHDIPTWFAAPVLGHSIKPEFPYRVAREVAPIGAMCLELFARTPRHAWTTWGDEIPGYLCEADPSSYLDVIEGDLSLQTLWDARALGATDIHVQPVMAAASQMNAAKFSAFFS